MDAAADILGTWQSLLRPEQAALIEAAADCDSGSPAAVKGLRKHWPADWVRCALELAKARQRAAVKFPDRPDVVADVAGIEQATSAMTADHKARRFAQVGISEITDLCCGIGGDAMSLVKIAEVVGVDESPVRAWMTEQNAGCAARVGDVTRIRLTGRAFHLDPARREATAGSNRRRLWRLEDYRPGSEFIARLLTECEDGAIKLGPGVDFDSLPTAPRMEIELISERGRLVQAVLWTGRLAFHAGQRAATILPAGISLTGHPSAVSPPPQTSGDLAGRFLLVPDPAAERAGLLGTLCGEHGLVELHPGLGILTGPDDPGSPWLTPFEIIEHLPWRPAKVRDALRSLGAGAVEVKTRGRAVDPDAARRQLSGEGERKLSVFVLRLGRKVQAVIAKRAGRKGAVADHPENDEAG
jgi:hypothetical protein